MEPDKAPTLRLGHDENIVAKAPEPVAAVAVTLNKGTDWRELQLLNIDEKFEPLIVLNKGTDWRELQLWNIVEKFVPFCVLNKGTDERE